MQSGGIDESFCLLKLCVAEQTLLLEVLAEGKVVSGQHGVQIVVAHIGHMGAAEIAVS